MNEFPNKRWTKISINRLLIKFGDTCAVNRLTGSGRQRSAHIEDKMLSYRRETALQGAL